MHRNISTSLCGNGTVYKIATLELYHSTVIKIFNTVNTGNAAGEVTVFVGRGSNIEKSKIASTIVYHKGETNIYKLFYDTNSFYIQVFYESAGHEIFVVSEAKPELVSISVDTLTEYVIPTT